MALLKRLALSLAVGLGALTWPHTRMGYAMASLEVLIAVFLFVRDPLNAAK
jgi:hypothetical protein